MIRRRIARLFLPALLLICLAAAMAWLLRTEPGARWVWYRASALVTGSLTARDVTGNLRTGLNFSELAFENATTEVSAGSVHVQLAFNLLPPGLSVEMLEADRVTIRSRRTGESAGGRSPEEILAALVLPLPIEFERVAVGKVVVQNAIGRTQFEGDSLQFTGRWHKRFVLREARVDALEMHWQAGGTIDFQPPYAVDANLNGRFEPTASDTRWPSAMQYVASFDGNLSAMDAEVQLDRPAARLQGHIRNLLTEPELQLRLSGPSLPWPLEADSPQWTLRLPAAEISGNWRHYQLELAGSLELPGLPESDVKVAASGDLKGIRIDDLQLSGELAQLKSSGAISWSEGFRLELSNAIERLDPRPWIAGWPADHPLRGTVDLAAQDDMLQFRNIDLEADGTAFRVNGSGTLDPEQDTVEGTLHWTSFQWPLGAEHPDFRSDEGRLHLQGKPDDWTASGTVQVQAAEWPTGQLRLSGQGGRESAQLVVEEGEVMGGRFKGEFAFGWTGSQPWSASFEAQDVDISVLSKGYPGVISASITAKGQIQQRMLDIDIRELHGRIRGQPVEAQGEIALAADKVRARGLQVRSGHSHVLFNGNVADSEGLTFSGHIDSLGAIFADASGSITGAGRLSSDVANPRIELDLQGSDLSWPGWRLASLSITSGGEASGGPATRMVVTGAEHGGRLLEELIVTLAGQRPLDRIAIEGLMDGTHLQAALSGSVTGWEQLSGVGWNGRIDSLRLGNEELGFLEMERPAGLAMAAGALQLEPACLRGPGGGRICLDANWNDGGERSINASLDTVKLDLLKLFLGSKLDFSQTLTGELHWESAADGIDSADVQILLSPGEVVPEEDDVTLPTGPGVFSFRIRDGQLLEGNLDISIPGAGTIDTDFRAPDVSTGIHSPVVGRMQVELMEIEPLTKWISGLDRFTGSVNADVRLAGTLDSPKMTGHASLVRGQIEYHAAGVTIRDIRLAGAVNEFDHTEFNGSFTSGDGQGRIRAEVDFGNLLNPEIVLELSGQNLTIINVPDMTVKADPDVRLRWQDNDLAVDGDVVIPMARISPRYLPTGIASESADLVIVAGAPPEAEKSFIDRSRLRLNGSVSVALGEDVSVTLERATAKLKGKALFNWNDSLLPIADGTYLVSGKITAFGLMLEVTEGRVHYPHVPADNPHLDIAAERQIYGNVQVKRAGVQISGTLKKPVMEAYTSPRTTEERALALLVTGHDFDYEQGVGAVEVGMYIAPKLYVSYGIGLFESENVISARYDLKGGWGIKATSGQRETGADLNYTIER